MKTTEFDYDLPKELIAQTPLANRKESRMLVVHKDKNNWEDRHFYDIIDYLHEGDVLVRNNTRVIPARLFGTKEETGAHVELLLLRQMEDDVWECLAGNAKVIKMDTVISFGDGRLKAQCVGFGEKGIRKMKMLYEGIFNEILDELGNVPLPPYIKEKLDDPERYQTVYAKVRGSAAAPTAGLHFTDEVFAQLIIAIGTTSVRTLESVYNRFGRFEECSGETTLFIYPGYEWHTADCILTNFHLPKSTLIMMISSFAGRELTFAAYRHAVEERYRFFSFGDCMLILNE